MILILISVLLAGLVSWLSLALLANAVCSRLALRKYKKQLINTPFLDHRQGWFGNHIAHWMGRCNLAQQKEDHKRLGDNIALMVNEQRVLSTIDLDFIERIIIEGALENIDRADIKLPMHEYDVDCILLAKGEQWRRLRRSFAPAFRPVQFRKENVVNEVQSSVEKLVSGIERSLGEDHGASKVFAADDLMHRFSMDVVMSCFYKQYDVISFDLDRPCHWVEMINSGLIECKKNPLIMIACCVPALSHAIDWLAFNLLPSGRWRRDTIEFIKQQAARSLEARKQLELRRQRGEAQLDLDNFLLDDGTKFNRNMIDHIIDRYHAGHLTTREFVHSSVFLFGAADTTTSDALTYAMYALGVHQDIQETLRESIRQQGEESEYLTWTINESLRLNPPAVTGGSRGTARETKLKSGDVLPANTFVFSPLHVIHTLPEYWGDDAEEFKPERWARAAEFHPAQFMPFGAGSRVCPGKEFAMSNMKKVLATLVLRYRFECKPKDDLDKAEAPLMIFLLHETPFFVSIRRC